MDGVKNILTSKTMHGLLVSALGMLLPLIGFTFGAEDQTAVLSAVSLVMEGGGLLWAAYGRVVATKKIG